MADLNAAPLSSSVLRNLADKLYEKRKTAALEVLPFSPFIDKKEFKPDFPV
jgi:hypothetical protein